MGASGFLRLSTSSQEELLPYHTIRLNFSSHVTLQQHGANKHCAADAAVYTSPPPPPGSALPRPAPQKPHGHTAHHGAYHAQVISLAVYSAVAWQILVFAEIGGTSQGVHVVPVSITCRQCGAIHKDPTDNFEAPSS
eukprot:6212362-Pleurochrysis_carterae.AAC.7